MGHECFPRIWHRYVDDVYAIIKKQKLRQFLNVLNKTKYTSIRFTHEEESDGKLNFLDLTVIRSNGKLEFDIYRKPTNTGRYITSDSYHSFKHKIAGFHSMIHRALNIPMTNERITIELQKIREIAHINGYTDALIDKLIRAHERKKHLREHTTLKLITDDDEQSSWSSFSFQHELIRGIAPILASQKIKISECSKSKMANLIGGSKDKMREHDNSGIYCIKCSDCNMKYIGQTRRAIIKRYKEHRGHCLRREIEKSSVAKHMVEANHTFDESDVKLIKRVDNFYELDANESFYINKYKNNLMNENEGPIKNSVFTKYYI